jgi:hypothetical protein
MLLVADRAAVLPQRLSSTSAEPLSSKQRQLKRRRLSKQLRGPLSAVPPVTHMSLHT